MSVARPLVRRLAAAAAHVRPDIRAFCASPLVQFPRRRPSPKEIFMSSTPTVTAPSSSSASLSSKQPPTPTAVDTAISNPPTPAYNATHYAELKAHFTPEQLQSILAGEDAISSEDFASRVTRRGGDPLGLSYIDDLSTIDPVLDFPASNTIPKTKLDKDGWVVPQQNLPVVQDAKYKYNHEDQEGDMYRNLSAHTGLSIEALKGVRSKIMVMHSVTNQTRMGKIRRMYALAVAGNSNGLLGVGEGKAAEAEDAIRQATYMAIRNMEPVPRYESRTTYGDIKIKNGAIEMTVFSRPPGFGIRCSQYIFEMCRCAGIHDLSARVTRSRKPMNVIKTFMKALKSQKLPETIARGRGKKFMDVRKVYYGGRT